MATSQGFAPLAWMTGLLTAAAGCNGDQAASAPPPPEVQVSKPILAKVAESGVFTGRTQAINYTDLRARVTGYLDKAPFKEGEDVKKDAVLFEIDPRPYEAALNQAKADQTLQQAQLTYNEADYKRTLSLRPSGAATQDDLDKSRAARDTAQAGVGKAKAAVEAAQLNLDFTKVHAPFDGRISRRQVDPGNLVKADDTVLASLVATDRLYAYFDVDERTLLHIRKELPLGQVPSDAAQKFPLKLGFADETPENFTHDGQLIFDDNKVDPNTGTMRMWGVFDNKTHDLFSGLFVRVRMGIGEPKPALFISEAALGSDQGSRFVYVVGDDDKTKYRKVEVGPRKDGLISVNIWDGEKTFDDQGKEKDPVGLLPTETIVVNGLQRVRAGVVVVPKVVPMPRAKTPATTMPVAPPKVAK
jgi:RND family efflux transporter MFP subunit